MLLGCPELRAHRGPCMRALQRLVRAFVCSKGGRSSGEAAGVQDIWPSDATHCPGCAGSATLAGRVVAISQLLGQTAGVLQDH